MAYSGDFSEKTEKRASLAESNALFIAEITAISARAEYGLPARSALPAFTLGAPPS